MIKKSKKNGFTLIECLLAILCDFVVMTLVLIFLNACVHILHIRTTNQDQMGILQLRQICATATDIDVQDSVLSLLYEHEEIELKYDRNRLVRTPGYEILLENISEAHFYEEDNKIFLSYSKEQEDYQFQIY